jgi:cell division protein FtsB
MHPDHTTLHRQRDSKLVPVLVAELKQLRARVASLEKLVKNFVDKT